MRAQVQEALDALPLLPIYSAVVEPRLAARLRADLASLEAEQLPEAGCAAPRSLEALRLEDPAAMSGCWNPGCAAGGSQWKGARGPLVTARSCMQSDTYLQS